MDDHSTIISQQDQQNLTATQIAGTAVLDFFAIVAKRRKFLSRFIVLSVIGTIIVTLLLPKWYKSTTVVMPAEKSELLGSLEGVSSLVKSFGGGKSVIGGNTDIDRYISIIKSDRLLFSVVEKFELAKVYNITSYVREKAVKELFSNMEVEESDEGNLVVSVYDKDPQRASDMANYIVERLNEVNSEISSQNAKANREFIEKRYEKNLNDLKLAEDALRLFQLKHGVLEMKEQTQVSIKTGAELYAQLVMKQVELGILRQTISENSPDIRSKEVEIIELQKKINEIRDGSNEESSQMKFLLPYKQTPQLAMDYFRLYRDVEIQNKILAYLTPIYEQAKVEEQRSTPSVLVLDKAIPAERKSKPKVSLYALMGFVISSFVSLCIVLLIEMVQRLRSLNPSSFDAIYTAAKSDWFGLKLKKR